MERVYLALVNVLLPPENQPLATSALCLQYPAKIRKMQVLTYSSLPLEQQSCGRKSCFPHANILQRASCAKTMVLHDILQLFRYYQVRVRLNFSVCSQYQKKSNQCVVAALPLQESV